MFHQYFSKKIEVKIAKIEILNESHKMSHGLPIRDFCMEMQLMSAFLPPKMILISGLYCIRDGHVYGCAYDFDTLIHLIVLMFQSLTFQENKSTPIYLNIKKK